MFHVTWSYISQFWIHEFTPNECVKERLSLSTAKNWTNKTTHLSWKRCEIGGKLQLFTHSKFKVALLMYMAHNRLSPLYISEMLAPVSSTLMHRQLRSSDSSNYTVPRTRTKPGDRAFSVAGLVIWNSIPESIRSVDNVHTFKRLLKTHFFKTNSTDFMSLHSAAISTVLCYFVLPSRSGSHTLGIKDTLLDQIRSYAACALTLIIHTSMQHANARVYQKCLDPDARLQMSVCSGYHLCDPDYITQTDFDQLYY